jgi:hypothetical protein
VCDGGAEETWCVDEDGKAFAGDVPIGEHVDATLARFGAEWANDGPGAGSLWEVYAVQHYCGLLTDCECAQYMTDHRPIWSRPTDPAPANMTRQHFELIAGTLADFAGTDWHRRLVERFAEVLAGTNDTFDAERFTDAAGLVTS